MPVDSRLLRRLVIVAVCALSLAVCCGLAYWQWERYSSAGGSFQNLGYVLQWPLFGLFPAFVFWRIRRLSQRAKGEASAASDAGADSPQPRGAARQSGSRHASPPTTPTPSGVARGAALVRQGGRDPGDTEDPGDAELVAYNRYLAELHARDQRSH